MASQESDLTQAMASLFVGDLPEDVNESTLFEKFSGTGTCPAPFLSA